jgi:hypothetical protein
VQSVAVVTLVTAGDAVPTVSCVTGCLSTYTSLHGLFDGYPYVVFHIHQPFERLSASHR